jgi:hypothetical protein
MCVRPALPWKKQLANYFENDRWSETRQAQTGPDSPGWSTGGDGPIITAVDAPGPPGMTVS